MLKTCTYCSTGFETNDSRKKFCSRSCAAKVNNRNRVPTMAHRSKVAEAMRSHMLLKGVRDENITQYLAAPSHCSECGTALSYDQRHHKTCGDRICRNSAQVKTGAGKMGGYRPGAGASKSGWYRNIWCDSSWELMFVIYCLDHNMTIVRNTDSWDYTTVDGIQRKYYPDFRVDGKLVEIKGPQRVNDQRKLQAVDEPIEYVQGMTAMRPYISYVMETYKVDAKTVVTLYDHTRFMFDYTCGYCGSIFTSPQKSRKFCSNSCSGNHRAITMHGK